MSEPSRPRRPSHRPGAGSLAKPVLGTALLVAALLLTAGGPASADSPPPDGRVYAMTNDSGANEIVVYERGAGGALTLLETVATGGAGETTEPDDALGSQSPLITTGDGKWLFAVNAGSDTISSLRITQQGVELVDVVPSGGLFPASLTVHHDLLYALNAGGDGNITGFRIRSNGKLTPLSGSTRTLGAGGDDPPFFLVSPAQVGFSPMGRQLVVTIKGEHPDHRILTYAIDETGRPSAAAVTTASMSTVSFGFSFDPDGRLFVAEPFGNQFDGTPAGGLSAASSYRLAADGSLEPISGSVANQQTATCWLVVTPDGRFAYTTNNGSASISSYRINPDGSLELIAAVAAATGPHPVDLAVSRNGKYLYNVNAGNGTVGAYAINAQTGALTSIGFIGGLPDDGSAVGMAAS